MYWALALVIVGGAAAAVQAGVNGRLGADLRHPVLAALASFLVGTLALVLFVLVGRVPMPSSDVLARVPWWAWTGGFLGAVCVAAIIVAVPKVGAATTIGVLVAGQMLTSVVLDHCGALGLERHPVTPARLLGIALVIAGVALLRRF